MRSVTSDQQPMKAWALRLIPVAAVAAVLTSSLAWSADIAERKFIREGMGEGEVLFKIGQPDHEAFIRNVKGEPEEKAWTYFPQPQDYQTLTIVTFRGGVVAKVERKIQR